jgi:dihydroneopterin aldolase
MNNHLTISLNKLHFFAYHGLYSEEKKVGAEFEVSLSVAFQANDKITSLDETVNYEKLYALLKNEMQKPRELLETLVIEITQAIHLSFPAIKKIDISITKLQVPIVGFTGNVSVISSKEY